MDQDTVSEEGPHQTATPTPSLDPDKAKAFHDRLVTQQNLPLGIVGGFAAALIGAAIWASVTILTQYQIGWMAVGVGFLVGYAVRILGKGISKPFGVAGAVCALLGCVLGNLFAVCGAYATQESTPFIPLAFKAITKPSLAFLLLEATFSPMDVLFYGIAVYEGYKFSFRQITAEELALLAGKEQVV